MPTIASPDLSGRKQAIWNLFLELTVYKERLAKSKNAITPQSIVQPMRNNLDNMILLFYNSMKTYPQIMVLSALTRRTLIFSPRRKKSRSAATPETNAQNPPKQCGLLPISVKTLTKILSTT